MAIVYQHIRLDTNVVFYIGISMYESRAYEFENRNRYWHNIVNKAGYEIQILHNDIEWEEACSIESELIFKYGRKDLKTGSLVNLTEGGEGVPGMKHSADTLKKLTVIANTPERIAISIENLKKANTPEGRKKKMENTDYSFLSKPEFDVHRKKAVAASKKACEKPIIQYDIKNGVVKEWSSATQASKELKICLSNISYVCNGIRTTAGGSVWKYKDVITP